MTDSLGSKEWDTILSGSKTGDPYFIVGYHVDRYYELEEYFLKVLKYMPLEIYNTSEAREKATSTYLADLLLRIGSNIDIVFRKMIMQKYKNIYDNKLQKINAKLIEKGKKQLTDEGFDLVSVDKALNSCINILYVFSSLASLLTF